jgi:selenocysteine lyase/cysteine desulfurase
LWCAAGSLPFPLAWRYPDFVMERQELWNLVREQVVGSGAVIRTPFGERRATYADYTATGRAVSFLERYLQEVLELYGNTHTEDDATGCVTTARLLQAEGTIKRLVNAGGHYRIIEAGSGATAAIHRLQEILGVYIPPAAKELFRELVVGALGRKGFRGFERELLARRPVVFVGPYEHHSNEISWRECFAEVIEIGLTPEGSFDLEDLQAKVARREYAGRLKMGSFSAASNVTGLITPVYEVARVLHDVGALAFFDFAAAAPYMPIDVERDERSYFDAVFFSPHKFLGGPGSSGVLIIHEGIYHKNLPPSMAGGGTVDFVNAYMQYYNPDIEVREKAGTPGILQILRAALAMELKEALGVEAIERRERALLAAALRHMNGCPSLELIAPMDPEHNLPIISFNLRAEDSYLHPRFVVRLLNDLFGIQARAGCSCAGPYGHRLLHIDDEESERYRELVLGGKLGLKPGWARLSLHFLMSDEELGFVCRAIRFVAEWGKYFLPLYSFDLHTGAWQHRCVPDEPVRFGLDQALKRTDESGRLAPEPGRAAAQPVPFDLYLDEALALARELEARYRGAPFPTTQADLIPFMYCPAGSPAASQT